MIPCLHLITLLNWAVLDHWFCTNRPDRFKTAFTVDDQQCSRKLVTANLVEKQEEVRALLHKNAWTSVCELAQVIHISVGSMHTILTRSLKLYAYRILTQQELKLGDYAKRIKFCNWFLCFMHGSFGSLHQVFFHGWIMDSFWPLHKLAELSNLIQWQPTYSHWMSITYAKSRYLVCRMLKTSSRTLFLWRYHYCCSILGYCARHYHISGWGWTVLLLPTRQAPGHRAGQTKFLRVFQWQSDLDWSLASQETPPHTTWLFLVGLH